MTSKPRCHDAMRPGLLRWIVSLSCVIVAAATAPAGVRCSFQTVRLGAPSGRNKTDTRRAMMARHAPERRFDAAALIRRLLAATCVVALNIILGGAAVGQTTIWDGTVSTDWFDGGNWSTGAVPGAANPVMIDSSTPPPGPTISMHAAIAFNLNLGSTNAGNVTIENGALLNTATISSANPVTDQIGGNSPGTVTVTGSGTNWTNNAGFGAGDIDVGNGDALGTLNIEHRASVSDSTGIVGAAAD
jgi:T5SS/PEP-CTERM-associated repeat protein